MGRYTKKQKFIHLLKSELENTDSYSPLKVSLYKEYIQHLTTNQPRWLYDTVITAAESYWDYMITNVDRTLTPEELITDMGEVLDTPVIRKMIDSLDNVKVL